MPILISFSQAKKIILENSGTTMAGIFTTAFSLVILGTFSLIYLNVINMSHVFLQRNHYSLFLEQSISQEERDTILQTLYAVPQIRDIQYISSEEALEDLIRSFGEKGELVKGLELYPLPAIIEFKHDKEFHPTLQKKIEQLPGVEELVFGKETVEQIKTFFKISNFIGWMLIILLGVSIVFIVSNSIKIALFSRLNEIEILKVLGATPQFIRGPYILEGVFISSVGFVFGLGGIFLIYVFLIAGITFSPSTSEFRVVAQFFTPWQMGLIFLFICFLGVSGSIFATNKIFKILDI